MLKHMLALRMTRPTVRSPALFLGGVSSLLERRQCASSSSTTPPPSEASSTLPPARGLSRCIAEQRRAISALDPTAPVLYRVDSSLRLVLLLAQSSLPLEQEEALDRGEGLWEALNDPSQPIPQTSRVAMIFRLSSSLRRCALHRGDLARGEAWTRRFQERMKETSVDDFSGAKDAAITLAAGESCGEGGPSSARGDESGSSSGSGSPGKPKKPTPLQEYKKSLWFDHPQLRWGKWRGKPTPGPRYTG